MNIYLEKILHFVDKYLDHTHKQLINTEFLRFPSERAAVGELGAAARGLAEHGGAAGADHHRVGVREQRRDAVAPGALDVHEVRVGVLYQPLQLVSPSLCPHIWLQQVHSEGHLLKMLVDCMNKMLDIGNVAPRCLVSGLSGLPM